MKGVGREAYSGWYFAEEKKVISHLRRDGEVGGEGMGTKEQGLVEAKIHEALD